MKTPSRFRITVSAALVFLFSLCQTSIASTNCSLTVLQWDYSSGTPPTELSNIIAIASGAQHGLALTGDGLVHAWGGNNYGQATPPADLTNAIAISAGIGQSLALRNDGTVVGWGDNSYLQTAPPAGLSGVINVIAGGDFSFAIKSNGVLVGWGDNSYGELNVPPSATNVIQLACGLVHCVGLRSNGTAVAWGYNYDGEINVPADLSNVVAVAAGAFHSLCLKSDGTVVGWGYNYYGEATPPSGLSNVVAIAAGYYHSVALLKDGTVVEWGYSSGINPPIGLSGVVAISAGGFQTVGLTTGVTMPASVQAQIPSADEIDLSWQETSTDSSGFEVDRASDNGGTPGIWTPVALVGGETTSFRDTNAVSGQPNWYRIQAQSDCGNSLFTTPFAVTFRAPDAPTSLGAIIGSTSNEADFFWSGTPVGVNGFQIDRAADLAGSPGEWIQVGDVAEGFSPYFNFADTNVAANMTVWYRVRAYNGIGVSSNSDAVMLQLFAPSTPVLLAAADLGGVTLNFENLLTGYEGFRIERADDVGGVPGNWTQIYDTFSDLESNGQMVDTNTVIGAAYWYRAKAYNWIGESPYSAAVPVALSPPAAPSNLIATFGPPVILAWSNPVASITSVTIQRAADVGGNPGTWSQVARFPSAVTNFGDVTGSADTTYWYRVQASDAFGDSPYSVASNVHVPDGRFLRVMQWNVEKGLGNIANNSSAQAQAIARIVNFNHPDVLLLCEVDAQSGQTVAQNQAALNDWVTNNVPYFGNQPGTTFFTSVASMTDGFNRNATISRFPFVLDVTANDGLRGLHNLRIQISPAISLAIFHTDLKCCSDDCNRKQTEAAFDATVLTGFRNGLLLPYIYGGDLNEDEDNPECPLSASYLPITTIRQAGRFADFRPTTLDGQYHTWSSQSSAPFIRLDYIYSETNRLTPFGGYVFSAPVWLQHGLFDGPSTDSATASDHYCIVADYFIPDTHFVVTGSGPFNSSGVSGGPFTTPTRVCTLSNTSPNLISWSATNAAIWLGISNSSGLLPPGATTNVTLQLSTAANLLDPGTYNDIVTFLNLSNGSTFHVEATLSVSPTVFQAWQIQYFGSITNSAAAPLADPDGDGVSNGQEFLAGTNPTNSGSALRITSIRSISSGLRIDWQTAGMRTNVLQAAASVQGNYSNISPEIYISGNGDSVTNFIETGTFNATSRFYRVQVVP